MIRLSDVLIINRHITSKELESVLYLLDPEHGHLHTFNDTAKFIWSRLQKNTEVKDIILDIEHEYYVSHDQAKKDVLAFLEKMLQKNVLRIKRRS